MLTVNVGNGWHRGRLGFMGGRGFYGDRLGLIAELEIVFDDGHRQQVASDESWTAGGSDVIADDLYDGQTIDAARSLGDGSRPAAHRTGSSRCGCWTFDTSTPRAVHRSSGDHAQELLEPVKVWPSPSGRTLVDFGQNLVGWVRFTRARARRVPRSGSGTRRCSSTRSSASARCATRSAPTASS